VKCSALQPTRRSSVATCKKKKAPPRGYAGKKSICAEKSLCRRSVKATMALAATPIHMIGTCPFTRPDRASPERQQPRCQKMPQA